MAIHRAEFEDFEGGRSQQAIVIVNPPIDPAATRKVRTGSIGGGQTGTFLLLTTYPVQWIIVVIIGEIPNPFFPSYPLKGGGGAHD